MRGGRLPNGELENLVLEHLWETNDWATPRTVHDAVEPERQLAYTTVMTILARLWKKGLLERRKDGKAFAYRPLITKEARAARRMGELLGAAGDRAVALARFVEDLDAEQRDALRRALRRSSPKA